MEADRLALRWAEADDRKRLLQVIQPGLVGLIDGTVSTLAPIFAAAYLAGSRAALLVGLAAASGPRSAWACPRASRMTGSSPGAAAR
jgi:erythrin-vacuolar iron transport family protein